MIGMGLLLAHLEPGYLLIWGASGIWWQDGGEPLALHDKQDFFYKVVIVEI